MQWQNNGLNKMIETELYEDHRKTNRHVYAETNKHLGIITIGIRDLEDGLTEVDLSTEDVILLLEEITTKLIPASKSQ